MTAAAKPNFANEFWFGAALGTAVKIAELDKIEPPQQERGTVNVTTHDSAGGAQEFIGEGTFDAGEISIGGVFLANGAGDVAFDAAFASGAVMAWKIVEKSATTNRQRSGLCIVTSPYNPEGFEIDGAQRFTATLKVTGAVTRAVAT